MTTTTDTTWLDIMPVIPLARGVPVYLCLGGVPNYSVRRVISAIEPDGTVAVSGHWDVVSMREQRWRVDLADPQGFAYALRHLLVAVRNEDEARERWPTAWAAAHRLWQDYRVQCGRATDADRMALARALVEVNA